MGKAWLGAIAIVVALGWLYFNAKVRTVRLRLPPSVDPAEHDSRT
jgi:hypothetical protein